MTVSELFKSELISMRTLNVCLDNNLHDVEDIFDFYTTNETFTNLKKCGVNTDSELMAICKKFRHEYFTGLSKKKKIVDDFLTSLEKEKIELIQDFISLRINNMNPRSRHGLKRFLRGNLKLDNYLEKIALNAHFSSTQLRNVGKSTFAEINETINEINSFFEEAIDIKLFEIKENLVKSKSSNSSLLLADRLNEHQLIIVNEYIKGLINRLSNRSQNVLRKIFQGEINFIDLNEKVFSKSDFKIYDFKNVGNKSAKEIDTFFSDILNFTTAISETVDFDHLDTFKNKLLFQNMFSIKEIDHEIFKSKSIFVVTDYLIKENVIFKKSENEVFLKFFKIYTDIRETTLNKTLREFNFSKERVRQITNILIDKLYESFLFVKIIPDNLFQKYNIDESNDILIVDQEMATKINIKNNVQFSREFITYLIYIYESENYSLLGKTNNVLKIGKYSTGKIHNWKNFYLIKKELKVVFDFEKLVDDIEDRRNQKIEETYHFNFKSYISDFFIINDFRKIKRVSDVAEEILNHEFEISVDLNENIVFNRNKEKNVAEYAVEALEVLNKPSKIEEIYNLIESEFPNTTKSADALRGSLQKSSKIIYFGRSSTYGLKKWELEMEGIRGGTIKDIVYEYLLKNDEPIHIYELLKEIHKFRETTVAKSVLLNLKLDPNNYFVIYNQNFVGLKDKKYNSRLTDLPKYLGKRIISYIQKNHDLNLDDLQSHFLNILKIDKKDMRNILMQLIENKSFSVNDKNKIYI